MLIHDGRRFWRHGGLGIKATGPGLKEQEIGARGKLGGGKKKTRDGQFVLKSKNRLFWCVG